MRRVKQQFGAFLLRIGHRYTGRTNLTAAHLRYLRCLELPAEQRFVLEEYLLALDGAHARIDRIENCMSERLETWKRQPEVNRLMGLKGFKIVAAMTLVSELGDLTRFLTNEQPYQRHA